MSDNKFIEFVSDVYFLKCVKRVCDSCPGSDKINEEKTQQNNVDLFKMIFNIIHKTV